MHRTPRRRLSRAAAAVTIAAAVIAAMWLAGRLPPPGTGIFAPPAAARPHWQQVTEWVWVK